MTSRPSTTDASGCPSFWRALAVFALKKRRNRPIIAFCLIAAIAHTQNQMSEYAVKAAYLFNFGKFVRFAPSDEESNRQTFDICLVGDDPLGPRLETLTANERLDGKPVHVTRLKSAAEARSCAIAYISAGESARLGADLDSFRGQPVLTVSDTPNFLQQGGMIQFINVGNHVRFNVNLDAVRNAQLSLGSELLKVAVSVSGQTPAEVRP